MIVLDTNVFSEFMRPTPAPHVMRWIKRLPSSAFAITSITAAEVLFGIELLPQGKRRNQLSQAAEKLFSETYQGRILPFDFDAARLFANISCIRRAKGKPIEEADAQIAAITLSHGARLATRDVSGFAHCGIDVIDPWTA